MNAKTLGGKYILGRLLGQGGMGAVYEAEDTEQKRRVAIKLINPQLTFSNAVGSRFEREAKVASAIQTEHIIRVLDTGTDPETGAPFMVMEYLRGEDLGQLLERLGPLPPELALRIVAQACVGLQKAHDASVMHRDIKPANLFLARREEGSEIVVKLLDFGIAKIKQVNEHREATTGLTRSGSMLGTPLYMSPEQARGIKHIDHRTDIWSLGIVLYRALAGRAPNEDVEAFGDLIAAIVADVPMPLQDFAPWIPPQIAAVVHGALQYDPDARYPSPSAMLEAIKPLLGKNGLSIDASMLVPLDPVERLSTAPRLGSVPSPIGPRRNFRSSPTAVTDIYLSDDGTPAALSATDGAPPPRSARKTVALALGAVLVAGAFGFGIYRETTTTPVAARGIGSAVPGMQLPPPITSPAPSTPTESPTLTHRVKLAIYPGNASVNVGGTAVQPQNGSIELTGALGSIHRVRVFIGKTEIEEDVVITAAGARPPKLKLNLSREPISQPVATASSVPATRPSGGFEPLMPPTFDP